MQRLQNKYFKKEVERMNTVKMGFTIEEAAECTGIGRNTMRKLVDWGKLIQRKLLPQFSLAAPLSNAIGTAAAGKPVAK